MNGLSNNSSCLFDGSSKSLEEIVSLSATVNELEIEKQVDIFSQSYFGELIQEKTTQKLSYVLGYAKNAGHHAFLFDGESLFKYVNVQARSPVKNPLTHELFDVIHFFEYEPTEKTFLFFATLDLASPLESEGQKVESVKKSIEFLVKANGEINREEKLLRQRWLGLQYEKVGQVARAIFYYEKAAEERSPQAIKRLIHLLEKTGNHKRASWWLAKLCKMEPENPAALFALAWRLDSGKWGIKQNQRKAFDLYQRVVKLEPSHTLALCKIVEGYEQNHFKQEALEWRKKLPLGLQAVEVKDLLSQALTFQSVELESKSLAL